MRSVSRPVDVEGGLVCWLLSDTVANCYLFQSRMFYLDQMRRCVGWVQMQSQMLLHTLKERVQALLFEKM